MPDVAESHGGHRRSLTTTVGLEHERPGLADRIGLTSFSSVLDRNVILEEEPILEHCHSSAGLQRAVRSALWCVKEELLLASYVTNAAAADHRPVTHCVHFAAWPSNAAQFEMSLPSKRTTAS
jgi:hypothetical protein